MKKLNYLFASIIITLALSVLPSGQVSAEPDASSVNVTVSQTILPPNCYDTVNVSGNSTDYIAVFECYYQRD